MSAPSCTRARSALARRSRPPLRPAGAAAAARAAWRAAEAGAAHDRARRQPPCGSE
ncbi:hypothetical protein [Massilia suwonensis]|uniref:Uncharacterized protein n=1 Tax=Massilia suwonensis TaxID=648895 RepID=A0ABW0MTG7_9BURK